MPAGPGSTVAPDVDMNVEKVGRTTEYTSSTITEVDVQIKIKDPNGNSFVFDKNFSTAWMSEKGDSGSLVCRGGEGGDEDKCDMCESTGTGMEFLGTDLRLDAAIEKEFRERHLSQTRVGRYLLDVYFRNEQRILDRVRAAGTHDSDRSFGRYLYDKHADAVRLALLQPRRDDVRVTEEQLRDAREALGRAMQHMKKDECHAAEELFKIVYRARDRTPREILAMLDDKSLLDEVRRVLAPLQSIEQPPPPRDPYPSAKGS
jgi:hypothetical protein